MFVRVFIQNDSTDVNKIWHIEDSLEGTHRLLLFFIIPRGRSTGRKVDIMILSLAVNMFRVVVKLIIVMFFL